MSGNPSLGGRRRWIVTLLAAALAGMGASYAEAAPAVSAQASEQPGGMPCQLDHVSAQEIDTCLAEHVNLLMTRLDADLSTVPDAFYPAVAKTMLQEHDFIEQALKRGEQYVPEMKQALDAVHMPPVLHYIALIESGYDATSVAPGGQAGLWQFTAATAKKYGLDVDERQDPTKSTQAAASYLNDLAFEFGRDSMLLVLAAYNCGESRVRRELRTLENPSTDRSYWRLVEKELLPEETSTYVVRFFATAVAGEAGLPTQAALAEAIPEESQ